MTQTFGVLGHPVGHSLSPLMFEAAFFEYNIDARYEKFDVAPLDLGKFLEEMRGGTAGGLSVTIPHKEAILGLLDDVDDKAKLIGAVNTVVSIRGAQGRAKGRSPERQKGGSAENMRKRSKLNGYNTDWLGALRALEDVTTLEGKRALVLGAGGAAAAIVYACLQAGAKVTILNRNVEKARELTARFKSQITVGAITDILSHPADILIHTTSVGMNPNINESLVPKEYFKRGMIVFDIIYNPLETRLVKDAKRAGCRIVPGYKMLLHQAEKQFELWFKKKPPLHKMEKALLDRL